MKIYNSMSELIGNTPILRLHNLERKNCLNAEMLAKIEYFNPVGSAKDRIALKMLADAEACGALKPGATIIEPTSGNTGVALCALAAAYGYKAVLVMPDTMSIERRLLAKAYGAQVVLTDGRLGMQGAVDKAEELKAQISDAFIPSQFTNMSNPKAHYETTGPEIWRDTDGNVDFFIASVGTGGTISGTGKYLKEQNPNIKVIAVEPASSPLLSEGHAGAHKIQGIGANFVPDTLDKSVYDEIIAVSDDDAYASAAEIAKCEGVFVGISSGAALAAAKTVAARSENSGKKIVVLLPDTGERYLSTPDFIK